MLITQAYVSNIISNVVNMLGNNLTNKLTVTNQRCSASLELPVNPTRSNSIPILNSSCKTYTFEQAQTIHLDFGWLIWIYEILNRDRNLNDISRLPNNLLAEKFRASFLTVDRAKVNRWENRNYFIHHKFSALDVMFLLNEFLRSNGRILIFRM